MFYLFFREVARRVFSGKGGETVEGIVKSRRTQEGATMDNVCDICTTKTGTKTQTTS